MWWRVILIILYALLCLAALVVSLTPSVVLNVWPYLTHQQSGMATAQFFLALGAALTPVAMEIGGFSAEWKWASWALLGVLLWVTVGNGIESSTLMRADLTFGHESKVTLAGDWNTQIEKWTSEAEELKKIKYVPTDEESLKAARDKSDTFCKVPISTDCKTAQAELKQVTHDYGLTKRMDRLERLIDDARDKLREVGAPPPDHLRRAAEEADWLPINPLHHKATSTALASEGWAAIGMKVLIAIISSLFTKAFGENWWKTPQFERESLQFKRESPVKPSPSEPASKPRKPFGLAYVPGFKAWMAVVRPVSGGPRKRHTPSAAFPHYCEFCEAKGFEAAKHVTTFGSLLKAYSELAPVAKIGGQSYYELNIEPKLALVKVGG